VEPTLNAIRFIAVVHGIITVSSWSCPVAAGPLGASTPIPTVNSDIANDADPMLSADGCELYFASMRDGGKYQLFRATLVN
jgi:hypothetical protein